MTGGELLRWATRALGLVAAILVAFAALVLDSLIVGALGILVAALVLMATRPSFWWTD